MNLLITADLHLTDLKRDTYRFDLFPWLNKMAKAHDVGRLLILGDITDAKDHHSAVLVNSIVNNFQKLDVDTEILEGNHDHKDPNHPFFQFLSHIPGLRFHHEPAILKMGGNNLLLLPHTKNVADWDSQKSAMKNADYIFIHQTMNDALASNGQKLPGVDQAIFKDLDAKVYSGDIHVPQVCGKVTYVGAPYTVHHDDTFEPRVLLIKNGKEVDLHFDTVRKWTLNIREADDLYKVKQLAKMDQVKIVVQLEREEAVDWRNHRTAVLSACKDLGLEVFGIKFVFPERTKRHRLDDDENSAGYSSVPKEPDEILRNFCKWEKVSGRLRNAGLNYLRS